MTNEELKQEAIKKAYGEYWKKVKNYIDMDGWVRRDFIVIDSASNFDFRSYFTTNDTIRPKSLSGIENNRGWIRIESEEQYDELENGSYYWYNINTGRYDSGDLWQYGTFTHYQPIIKPELPIY